MTRYEIIVETDAPQIVSKIKDAFDLVAEWTSEETDQPQPMQVTMFEENADTGKTGDALLSRTYDPEGTVTVNVTRAVNLRHYSNWFAVEIPSDVYARLTSDDLTEEEKDALLEPYIGERECDTDTMDQVDDEDANLWLDVALHEEEK